MLLAHSSKVTRWRQGRIKSPRRSACISHKSLPNVVVHFPSFLSLPRCPKSACRIILQPEQRVVLRNVWTGRRSSGRTPVCAGGIVWQRRASFHRPGWGSSLCSIEDFRHYSTLFSSWRRMEYYCWASERWVSFYTQWFIITGTLGFYCIALEETYSKW